MAGNKRLPLFIVLGVVIVGVGVFQFVNNQGDTPAATTEQPKAHPGPGLDPGGESALADGQYAPFAPRDPFKPDEDLTPPNDVKPPSNPSPTPPSKTAFDPGMLKPLPDPSLGATRPVTGSGPSPAPPQEPLPEPKPEYTLTGVVVGNRPIALFRDSHGVQMLAREHDTLDGEFQIKSISRQAVVLQRGKKSYSLTLGGPAGDTNP